MKGSEMVGWKRARLQAQTYLKVKPLTIGVLLPLISWR